MISKCFRFIPNKRVRSKLFSNRFKLLEYYFFSSKNLDDFQLSICLIFFKASNWVKMFRRLFDIVSDLLKNYLHVCTLCQTSFRWFQVIAEFENESNHFVTFSSSSRSFQTCFRQSRCFQVFFFPRRNMLRKKWHPAQTKKQENDTKRKGKTASWN